MPVKTQAETQTSKFLGERIPFSACEQPGTYVSNWTGHLIRIPGDALKEGRSPAIEILGKDTMYVTKLSDDPYLPLTKARMIAANNDIVVNF